MASALLLAAEYPHYRIIELLLKYGAVDKHAMAYQSATAFGDTVLAELLQPVPSDN